MGFFFIAICEELCYINTVTNRGGSGEAVRKHGVPIPNGIVHTINEPGSVGKHKLRATTWSDSLRVQFPSDQPCSALGIRYFIFGKMSIYIL